MNSYSISVKASLAIASIVAITTFGCRKHDHNPPPPLTYNQVNLVSDVGGFGAMRTDPMLKNAWGIAISPNGIFWISANHTGSTVVYDRHGNQIIPAVAIPSGANKFGGSPTGAVFNSTPSDFVIAAKKQKSRFIFANEDGTISAWSSGDATVTVADRSSQDAVYKGLAIGNDGGANFLYATNFKGAKIDVFDSHFNYVTGKPFIDPFIPAGFAPFNIKNINGYLFVTYAKQLLPDKEDDDKGPGRGYVDIFTTSGMLVKRFASQGTLNSPWGITLAPDDFGQGPNTVLIGNFGDGRINVFKTDGAFKGQLTHVGAPLTIDGLWEITFPGNIPGDHEQLFFTAGPDDENHGLFGYIEKE